MKIVLKKIAKALPADWVNDLLFGAEVRFIPSRFFRKAQIAPVQPGKRRLLVDVTHQVNVPQRGGIPRVVAGMAKELLKRETEGTVTVVFVRLVNGVLFSAQRYRERLTGRPIGSLGRDIKIQVSAGDDIVMIGANFDRFRYLVPYFQRVQSLGGVGVSVINDLMPYAHPEWFDEDFTKVFYRAIPEIVNASDVILCVSATVAAEMGRFIADRFPERAAHVRVTTFDQGAEINDGGNDSDSPIRPELRLFLESAAEEDAPIFAQVSVIQPRKGQDFALDVFERRWARGAVDRLLYVGRKGWKADELYARIAAHPESGKRFLYVENASERELALIYDRSLALLSPSRGEGYGLPVVEGAQRGLPVILSDLPVYRELAGEAGFFFPLGDLAGCDQRIDEVIALPAEKRSERVRKIRIGTWRQGVDDLFAALERGRERRAA